MLLAFAVSEPGLANVAGRGQSNLVYIFLKKWKVLCEVVKSATINAATNFSTRFSISFFANVLRGKNEDWFKRRNGTSDVTMFVLAEETTLFLNFIRTNNSKEGVL